MTITQLSANSAISPIANLKLKCLIAISNEEKLKKLCQERMPKLLREYRWGNVSLDYALNVTVISPDSPAFTNWQAENLVLPELTEDQGLEILLPREKQWAVLYDDYCAGRPEGFLLRFLSTYEAVPTLEKLYDNMGLAIVIAKRVMEVAQVGRFDPKACKQKIAPFLLWGTYQATLTPFEKMPVDFCKAFVSLASVGEAVGILRILEKKGLPLKQYAQEGPLLSGAVRRGQVEAFQFWLDRDAMRPGIDYIFECATCIKQPGTQKILKLILEKGLYKKKHLKSLNAVARSAAFRGSVEGFKLAWFYDAGKHISVSECRQLAQEENQIEVIELLKDCKTGHSCTIQ